jgi:hypothetical protein
MRRAVARSAGIDHPNGASQHFQRSAYNVDPSTSVSTRNLLANDWHISEVADEAIKFGEQVALVGLPFMVASDAIKSSSSDSVRHRARRVADGASKGWSGATERRARAGSADKGPVIGPSDDTCRQRPDAQSREEMPLRESFQVGRLYVRNAARVDDPRRDQTVRY